MPPYHETFRIGENIRIVAEDILDDFRVHWTHHHPLQKDQLAYAGLSCFVRRVSYYHGGDCLYELSRWESKEDVAYSSIEEYIPGYWHESCLRDPDLKQFQISLPLASDVYSVICDVRNNQPVVVVRTFDGIECLVLRHSDNEPEANRMRLVAAQRCTLAYEWRYNFQGVAHDAMRQKYQSNKS